MALIELLQEAGCPPGVVNVIHGQHDAVNFICDHPDIHAISFVGGDTAGKYSDDFPSNNMSLLIGEAIKDFLFRF